MSIALTYAIIFGAGASFGSGPVIPKPPPMTNDLLNALERLFPTVWGALPEGQRALLRKDFEAGMREIGHKNPHDLPPLQRSMASFFFGFVPGEGNLYRNLARRIKAKAWPGALISLNYERLLELSLAVEGVSPFIGSPPDNGPSVELCLPHGCCHIFCESVRGTARGISLSGTAVSTRGPVKTVTSPGEYAKRIREDAFPPVMSYFDPAKLTTSGVNFIEEQRARYNTIVKGAKVVAIIGIRVRPNDKHLWEALALTHAQVVYSSGKDRGRDFAEWARDNRKGKASAVLYSYFGEGFEEICARVNLGRKPDCG